MNVFVSHLLSREDTDTTTIIRIEIEKRDINTKYRKTNKKIIQTKSASHLSIIITIIITCCPVLLAPSIEDPGVAVNDTPSSWKYHFLSTALECISKDTFWKFRTYIKAKSPQTFKNYLYLWRTLAKDGLLNLDPVFGNTTPIWKPEGPPWWKGNYKSGSDISKKRGRRHFII